MKTDTSIHRLTTPGNIFLRLSAAVSALGFPPLAQSSNANNDCLAGLE